MPSFELATSLPVSPSRLASDLLTMEGVNYELSPILKMTAPKNWAAKPISQWPENCELFSSKILLCGVLPVDLHRFKFQSVHRLGFKESSRSLFNHHWSHERTILVNNTGATVKDVVLYENKLTFLGCLLLPLYKSLFAHRHKRLKLKYLQSS